MNSEPYVKSHFEPLGQPLHHMDYATYFNHPTTAAAAAQQPLEFGAPGLPHLHSHAAAAAGAALPSSGDFGYHSPPQNAFDFQTFDAYNHFNSQGIAEPPTPQSQPRASQASNSHDGTDTAMDLLQQRQGSNSGNEDDDENMTPAQSRRKAQNRAAQRAFRERKEKHVKDLEAQLAALRASTNSITTENERLRLSLQKVSTENEILKATTSANSHAGSHSSPGSLPDTTAPMHYSPKDFYSDLLETHDNKTPSHRVVMTEGGGRLLGAGATWDFILSSREFKAGLVDVGRVSEELKGRARCDGQGPVFEEGDVRRAIEIGAVAGSDELI